MKTRLATPIGHRAYKRDSEDPCKHYKDFHLGVTSDDVFGQEFECDKCKKLFIPNSYGRYYDTPTGELQPGDMFWNTWYPEDMFWNNHKGPHLMVVLPNGDNWNIDSRASNCTMKEDKTHRCWVREGTPPNITVGKAGHTCAAGAGSIQSTNYHGFLRNGEFIP